MMKIVLLGSGNVATQLGRALVAQGEVILQVYSQNPEHAKTLADALHAEGVSKIANLVWNADLYIIAVKDDAIETIAVGLTDVEGLVVHTSGATDISGLTKFLPRAGVFYPLQTFSKTKDVDFKTIPLCLETTQPDDLGLLLELAGKLSNSVHVLDGEKRKVLHLAAVFACNFPNQLFALANQVLTQNGLDFNIIRPLIAETNDKIMVSLPKDVQTGPAVRNDEQTINTHLAMLTGLPDLQEIYQTLSNSIKKTHK